MRKLKVSLLLLSSNLVLTISAQKLVKVTDQNIIVNSMTALSGITRNKADVVLPENTQSYIYRITITSKGTTDNSPALFEALKAIGGSNIAIGVELAEQAIKNNDNSAVDAFIFTNTFDADNFLAKNEKNWSSCKFLLNRGNCCFGTNECLGKTVYFGFRNNNIRTGIIVRLEVVALVDTTTQIGSKYAYTINNTTDKELKFFVSPDNIHWEQIILRSGYLQNFSFTEQEIYFKIQTDMQKISIHKLSPNERYKLVWNSLQMKWDLARY